MKVVESEGETIDEAITNGLATLGIPREDARVEILQDARRGLLGFGGQKARVRVSPRAGSSDPAPSEAGSSGGSAEGARDRSERSAAPQASDASAGVDDAERILRDMLALMGVTAEVATDADESGQPLLRITSESGGLLIGRHGQTLEALEYLINRIVSRHDEHGARIGVDAEGYRARRREELREMASRLAVRARQTARPQSMNPLSPRERRIVHLALSDDPTVSTRSVGEGHLRRVVIYPARR